MRLLRYRELNPYEIRDLLDEYIGLTDYQKEKLVDTGWLPFHIIKYESPEPVRPILEIDYSTLLDICSFYGFIGNTSKMAFNGESVFFR